MRAGHTASTFIATFVRLRFACRGVNWLAWSAFILLVAFCLVAGSGLYPFLLDDEARHAGIVHDMCAALHYLMPRIDGFPVLDGAPLFYWLSQGPVALFGIHEWVMRLPSAIAAALLLGGVGTAFLPVGFRNPPWLLLVLFLMQPAVWLGSRYASPDMLGLMLLCAALAAFWKAAERAQMRRWALPWVLLAWGATALLGLAVGVLAVVLPVGVVAIWLLLRRRSDLFPSLFCWRGMVLCLGMLLPWWLWADHHYPGIALVMLQEQALSLFWEGRLGWGEELSGRPWLWALLGGLPLLMTLYRFHDQGRRARLKTPLAGLMGVWLLMLAVFHPLMALSPVGHLLALVVPLLYFAVHAMAPAVPTSWWREAVAWWPPVLAAVVIAWLGMGALASRTSDIAPVKELLGRHYIPVTDKVIMLDRFDYDFNFYMRSPKLVYVAGNWGQEQASDPQRWMRDFSRAASFVPDVAASLLLRTRSTEGNVRAGHDSDLPDSKTLFDRLCERRVVNLWIVSNSDGLRQYPVLSQLLPFASTERLRVWYLEAGRVPPYCTTPVLPR